MDDAKSENVGTLLFMTPDIIKKLCLEAHYHHQE